MGEQIARERGGARAIRLAVVIDGGRDGGDDAAKVPVGHFDLMGRASGMMAQTLLGELLWLATFVGDDCFNRAYVRCRRPA